MSKPLHLTGDELVIADDKGALALAGIMGGQRSSVTDSTTNILLESAFFDQLAIAARARRFGLHTDASQRFERGVDFELPALALARACDLITSITGRPSWSDSQRSKTLSICQSVRQLRCQSLKYVMSLGLTLTHQRWCVS